MNYAKIRNYDIANGEGVRVTLFVSGCTNNCPDCFNKDEQDFNFGEKYTPECEEDILRLVSNSVISGLSILGGDPLCQNPEGLNMLIRLCDRVHSMGKDVWLWTGFTWDNIMSHGLAEQKELLRHCDIVVDGLFKRDLASRALKWRGSSNQRVIDVERSLKHHEVILYE